MLGVLGEWCFATLAGSEFDASVHPRSWVRGQDRDLDTTYGGVRIDVKTTDYPHGRLVVSPWKGKSGDAYIYALMVLIARQPVIVEFKGFAEQKMVRGFPANLGHGSTFAVPQSHLLEWWMLNTPDDKESRHA